MKLLTLLLFSLSIASAQASYEYEKERIQRRLELIENMLRRQDPLPSAMLQDARERNLNRLHEYWQKGSFPKNTNHPGLRVPYFIDNEGVPCAVGYLLLQDGHHALAEKVRSQANNIYVDQIRDPEFLDWADHSGLSLTELELIQPAYEGMDAPELKSLASKDYAAVKKKFVNGKPPANFLSSAIACGDLEGAAWLLSNGASASLPANDLLECNGNSGGNKVFPLETAVQLLQRPTYFRIEFRNGKIKIKEWPTMEGEQDFIPLSKKRRIAVHNLVKKLLSGIEDVGPMNDTLMSAVATGDSELVKILLSKKWDLKATGDSFSTDSNSDTLYIMSKKDEDVCRFRKYPLASSLKGATVLDLALWNGDEKIAKLLKEKGAITKIDPVKVNSEQAGELPPCTDAQKKLALRAQQID